MEQKFANLYGWTDITPFEVLKETAKTISIRMMDSKRDPNWRPEIIQGGFVGNCVNNAEQKWDITTNEKNPVIKAYLRKDGNYHSKYRKHKMSNIPVRFYDYNF